MQSAHHFDIKRLQRVTCRLDKVDTCVNSVINNVHPVDFVLSIKVGIKSLLNVFNDRSP